MKKKELNRKIPTAEETRKRIDAEQAPIFKDLLDRCIDSIAKTRSFPIQVDFRTANDDTRERVASKLRKAGWSVIISQNFLIIRLPGPGETPIDYIFELMKNMNEKG